jgi:hypothetical protein
VEIGALWRAAGGTPRAKQGQRAGRAELAILVVATGLLRSAGGARERGEPSAFPEPLEYDIWDTPRGCTGFDDYRERRQTAKMLAGSESSERVRA